MARQFGCGSVANGHKGSSWLQIEAKSFQTALCCPPLGWGCTGFQRAQVPETARALSELPVSSCFSLGQIIVSELSLLHTQPRSDQQSEPDTPSKESLQHVKAAGEICRNSDA